MAIGLRRKVRLDSRRFHQKVVRNGNGLTKQRERARRDARMISQLQTRREDPAPALKSWLSAQLGKPFRQITPEDISALLG